MGEFGFVKYVINSTEDVPTVKGSVAAGIPIALAGAQGALVGISEAALAGDLAGIRVGSDSLAQFVEQLESFAQGEKAANEYVAGSQARAAPEAKAAVHKHA